MFQNPGDMEEWNGMDGWNGMEIMEWMEWNGMEWNGMETGRWNGSINGPEEE